MLLRMMCSYSFMFLSLLLLLFHVLFSISVLSFSVFLLTNSNKFFKLVKQCLEDSLTSDALPVPLLRQVYVLGFLGS